MNWLLRMLPTCRDVTRLLSDSMDRPLPFHARIRLNLHLRMCVLCERYKHQLLLLRDVLRKDGARLVEADRLEKPGLSAEARDRIRRAIESSRTPPPNP